MKYFWILYILVLVHNAVTQSMYRAAVVEFAPKIYPETFANRILENVEEYVNFISEAADEAVDIIVFPESGLTGTDINENNIYELSMEVPDPNLQISPCNSENSKYSKALIDLSCSAQTHRIYVVVNLLERRNETGNVTYFNTNIVLNREGVVVSRYRKINLYKEQYVRPGNEKATFRTDFGVTFGMFICNDIMFKNPALDTLADLSVVNIIYSHAWFTELPFSEALSVQHGYAVSNGINLLSAGLSDPMNSNGGSGIFLLNGKMPLIYKTGAKSSKMLIANIKKDDKRNNTRQCQLVTDTSADITNDEREYKQRLLWGTLPNISQFKTIQQDLTNFTMKTINLNQINITEEICIGINKKFCCSIIINAKTVNTPNYTYKLAIFNGGRELGWETIGMRACGIIICLNTNNNSCGLRHATEPRGVVFNTLFLKASYPNSKTAHDQPSTLTYDLKPLNNYTFCKTVNGEMVELTLSTANQSSLLTFGFFGRVFDNDHKGTGSFNSATMYIINPYTVFIVSIIIFLLQE